MRAHLSLLERALHAFQTTAAAAAAAGGRPTADIFIADVNVDRVQPFLLAAAVVVATVWNSRAETSNVILYYVVYSISRDLKRCGGLKIR